MTARAKALRTTCAIRRRLPGIAHAMGVGLECDLGSVAGLTDEAGNEDKMVYTDPAGAASFLERTGADFLAVSIGTAHGVYQGQALPGHSPPEADSRRGGRSAGSGTALRPFGRRFPQYHQGGIAKVNVFTDVILAGQARPGGKSGGRLYRRRLPGARGHEAGGDGKTRPVRQRGQSVNGEPPVSPAAWRPAMPVGIAFTTQCGGSFFIYRNGHPHLAEPLPAPFLQIPGWK